jgi:predicted nucleic acid-binding protein
MAATFVDTDYLLALVNTSAKYQDRARITASVDTPPFVSTEAVLIEIGNSLSGLRRRTIAVATLTNLRPVTNVQIIPVDANSFERALDLFASRSDKEWSVTGCLSFVIMQEHGLTQVLTTDRHFEQAGFQNLLAK